MKVLKTKEKPIYLKFQKLTYFPEKHDFSKKPIQHKKQ